MNWKKSKAKIILLTKKYDKLRPHTMGKRSLEELVRQMKNYVNFLKKRGVKVIKLKTYKF